MAKTDGPRAHGSRIASASGAGIDAMSWAAYCASSVGRHADRRQHKQRVERRGAGPSTPVKQRAPRDGGRFGSRRSTRRTTVGCRLLGHGPRKPAVKVWIDPLDPCGQRRMRRKGLEPVRPEGTAKEHVTGGFGFRCLHS